MSSPAKAHDIQARALEFAVRAVKLCQYMDAKPGVARTLSRQLLRSATSIGANLEEAQAGHSKRDFICKVEIALKEARETSYWLRLVVAAGIVSVTRISALRVEAEELAKILGSITVSAKRT